MTLKAVICAMMLVESGGDPRAYNARENAAGVLQVRPIMLNEVNRLLGYEEFTNKDRWCPVRSEQMAVIFADRHGYKPEEFARRWNAGSNWRGRQADGYWRKVRERL